MTAASRCRCGSIFTITARTVSNGAYGGSGPAQLALAIVADAIGAPMGKKPPSGFEHDSNKRLMAVRLHQDFKRQFIAGLARNLRWTITEKTVLEFTARYQKESTHVDTQS
jgi:hypothetical protein